MNPSHYQTEEDFHHLIQKLLNLTPSPMLLMERNEPRMGTYANRAAIHYILPDVEPGNLAYNAKLINERINLWQTGMLNSKGEPIPFEERPGVRLLRGEEFAGQEIQWIHPINHKKYHIMVYGCLIPPNFGLLSFMDMTKCVEHLEQLNAALLSKEEFYRQTSHELRTPLTTILFNIQIIDRLLRKPEPEAGLVMDKLKVIQRAALELTRIIDELLTQSFERANHSRVEE